MICTRHPSLAPSFATLASLKVKSYAQKFMQEFVEAT
jgi:hypothetical protein